MTEVANQSTGLYTNKDGGIYCRGKLNQVLLRNIDCYLRNMCCKVDRKIKQSS